MKTEKSNAGRKLDYGEKTRRFSRYVPISKWDDFVETFERLSARWKKEARARARASRSDSQQK